MCGVFLAVGRLDDELIKKLMSANSKRGDDYQQLLRRDKFCMGVHRLTINDVVNQEPIFSTESKSVYTVTSGEIYNYHELKKTLESKGYQFRTRNDTEIVLHGYLEWGTGLFTVLKGMFSLLIVDVGNNCAIVGRDKFGMKPLYWSGKDDQFYCSTAAKPLNSLHKRGLSIEHFLEFCYRQYILPPRTIYQHVNCIAPGTFMRINLESLEVSESSYWESSEFFSHFREIEEEEFENRFQEAVNRHSHSDFDIGLMLSGGADSVALLAADQGHSISHSYFLQNSEDKDLVTRLTNQIGIPNTVIHAVEDFSDTTYRRWLDAVDDFPPSDGMNTFMITTHSQSKVLLSGVGADELMNGYTTLSNAFSVADLAEKRSLVTRFLKLTQLFPDRWLRPVFERSGLCFSKFYEEIVADYMDLISDDIGGYESIRVLLIKTYLAQRLLVDADTFSLVNRVEIRAPFLDDDLVKLLFQIPNEFFCSQGGKYAKIPLKRYIQKELGDDSFRRQKLGFVMPYEHLLHVLDASLSTKVHRYLNSYQRWTILAMNRWLDKVGASEIPPFYG